MWRILICSSCLLVALCSCVDANDQKDITERDSPGSLDNRSVISGPFTPDSGHTLLIVGQDLGAIAGYVASTGRAPGGVTTYTDLSEGDHAALLHGLTDSANWGSGDINAQTLVATYDRAVLAIGLNMVDHTGSNLAHLADGTHDDAIDELGRFIVASRRPVFLRIGYEFDGEWNHYEPAGYVAAFRHIVARLRAGGVDNFASVWQSATSGYGTYGGQAVDAWYPGDEWVDWFGSSYFVFHEAVHADFLDLARKHGKPLLIAESTPQGYDVEALTHSDPGDGKQFRSLTYQQLWSEWYEPFFEFIRTNRDVIRAVAYINVDWKNQPMWGPTGGSGYWGDSRVQANADILDRWMRETSTDPWVHGSATLFRSLGY